DAPTPIRPPSSCSNGGDSGDYFPAGSEGCYPTMMKFFPLRLAIVMLGDRLSVAAIQRDRHEVFTIDAENPGAALRAELDARNLVARKVAIGLARSAGTGKPIELPAIAGETHEMVEFERGGPRPVPGGE